MPYRDRGRYGDGGRECTNTICTRMHGTAFSTRTSEQLHLLGLGRPKTCSSAISQNFTPEQIIGCVTQTSQSVGFGSIRAAFEGFTLAQGLGKTS